MGGKQNMLKERIFRTIVYHRKVIVFVFAFLGILAAFSASFVEVNHDMVDYLPSSSPSTQAIHTMEEEFPQQPSTIRLMTETIGLNEAEEMKAELAALDNVSSVEWLDDVENIEKPLEQMDQTAVADYYLNGKALFTISVDTTDTTDQYTLIEEIRTIAGDEGQLEGTLLQDYELDQHTSKDLYTTIGFAVLIAFLILLFFTSAWIEPVLILGTIGLAILINAGTNIFLGEISFVTSNAFPILQLGVSIDYSIFLLHRYEEYQREGIVQEEAMVKALTQSLGSVLSSGLTTVIGFAALILMKFGIGADMGIVLAKGVILSLLAVFIFLPAITLMSANVLEKTTHRSFIPSLKPLANLVYRVRYITFPLIIISSGIFFMAQYQNNFYYGSSMWLSEDNTVMQEKAAVDETFGHTNVMALMIPNKDEAKEKALLNDLSDFDHLTNVQAYSNEVGWTVPIQYVPEKTRELLQSPHYSRIAIESDLPAESKETFALIDSINQKAQAQFGEDYLLAGDSVSTYDLKDVINSDQQIVNAASIIGILIVILFAFKSLTLPAILVLSIQSAIWINLGLPYFRGSTLFYIAYLILSSVQLGATVDYAVLLTDRYLEERRLLNKKAALLSAIEKSGESIIVSGTIMTAAGFLFGAFSTNQVPAQIGLLLAQGTILSMIVVFFGLPIFLYIADRLIEKTSKGLEFK
ncbi:efflux RND transporter permease subunit [Alkalibacterium gilvum]|nr:efflux RND transporter permease subunit [Alkalibacterium gilvum]